MKFKKIGMQMEKVTFEDERLTGITIASVVLFVREVGIPVELLSQVVVAAPDISQDCCSRV